MRAIFFTFVILVIVTMSNSGVDGIMNQIKKGANKMGDVSKKISHEVAGKAVDYFCTHSGELGAFAGKGFGVISCDESEHGTEEWCKHVGDAHTIFDMICCLGNEQRQIAMEKMAECFQTTDHTGQQGCLKGFHDWIMQFKEAAEMASNAGK